MIGGKKVRLLVLDFFLSLFVIAFILFIKKNLCTFYFNFYLKISKNKLTFY